MDTLCKKSFVINPYPYLILGGIQYTSPPLLGNLQYLPDEEGFWWQIFLLLFIFTLDAFWPNLMAVSLQLLKLWLLFKGRCSQNRDFTVKTPYKWQILERAVKCEQPNIYTWNLVRILVFYTGITSIRKSFTISIVFNVFLLSSIFVKQ